MISCLYKALDRVERSSESLKNSIQGGSSRTLLTDIGEEKNSVLIERLNTGVQLIPALRFVDSHMNRSLIMNYFLKGVDDWDKTQEHIRYLIQRLIRSTQILQDLGYQQTGILSFSNAGARILLDEWNASTHFVHLIYEGYSDRIFIDEKNVEDDEILNAMRSLEKGCLTVERISMMDKRLVDWIVKG